MMIVPVLLFKLMKRIINLFETIIVFLGILAAKVDNPSPDTMTNGLVFSNIAEPSVLTMHNKDEENETQKSLGWFLCSGTSNGQYIIMLYYYC